MFNDRALKRLMGIALEEDASGTFNKEIEYVFYARLSNFEQFNSAVEKEAQEQWEIKIPYNGKNAAKGRVRIRRTVSPGKAPEYVLTTKIATNEAGDQMEVSTSATADQFVQFQFMADVGMVKDRFCFKADNGLTWEVDLFAKAEGGYHEWCKIDLEVPSRDKPLPAFPIAFDEMLNANEDGNRAKIQELYSTIFLTKNRFTQESNPDAQNPETLPASVPGGENPGTPETAAPEVGEATETPPVEDTTSDVVTPLPEDTSADEVSP